ncbi:hypothetical protein DRE_03479 [Drechslerella stenobrocha 248]|uniref:Uncharacterized protein n=1 Tax=Drechslerella stenobrocha 248 TaxID=1043628 RepID=W7IDN7_9PEZI|nr:hypothetical protein DRE_03479 [Drechslerella stenobrocha 248]
MSLSLRKLQLRAAASSAEDHGHPSHSPYPDVPATAAVYSDGKVSTRIHKIEQELADLPLNSPLRPNFQAILRDYRERGEADMMYQNGRAVNAVNVDLRRGPLYVERCAISIMSDE